MRFSKEEIIVLEALKAGIASVHKTSSSSEKFSFLLALSGGLDSQVLLAALCKFQEHLDIQFSVCHIDHGLRENSNAQSEEVAELCRALNIQCDIRKAPTWDGHTNIEAWAREIRYKLLEEARELRKCNLILTAHHSGDQAETFLFSLLSGRGIKHFSGISPLCLDRRIWRPFLDVSKQTIQECAKLWDIKQIYDETNDDLSRTRNHIRHKLLPLLAKDYNPSIESTLSTIQARIREDEECLWAEARRLLDSNENISEIAAKETLSLAWRCLSLLSEKQLGEVANSIGYLKLKKIINTLNEKSSGPRIVELGNNLKCKISGKHEVTFFKAHSGQ